MSTIIEKADDLKELASFLSELNNRKESHIGYCGNKAEEIHKTLKEDFIDGDEDIKFLVAKNSMGNILAAIGFDIDGAEAEVWGPFNQIASIDLEHRLWERLVKENSTIKDFYFFINKENHHQQQFMNEIYAKQTGEHLNLEVREQNFDKVSELKSIPFQDNDFQAFENLHNTLFPNTYYDAMTIVKRINDENTLKVIKNKANELQGYAYFEIDSEMEEATLEYIGISDKARNQGLGTMMLREALTEMFSHPLINEIKLTVEDTNSQANHVYMKAGFEKKDRLISYHLSTVNI